MWQEGQQDDDESFDDLPENFVRCALHQGANEKALLLGLHINRVPFLAKLSRERWRFWLGEVPSDVSVSEGIFEEVCRSGVCV